MIGDNYKNSNTPLEYICEKHPDKINRTSLSNILAGTRCKWCVWESLKGEGAHRWKGGVTEIQEVLRCRIESWKKEILENHSYKCDITKGNHRNMEVHHLRPFHYIRDEIISELGMKGKANLSNFTNDELDNLIKLFDKKHREVGGVPLHRDLHKLFHKLYGFDVNEDDYREFKERYLKGEFKVESIEKWKVETNKGLRTRKKPKLIYKGEHVSFAEASRITGVSISTLHERYKRGDRGEKLFRPVRGLGCAKLTEKEVMEVRRLLDEGVKQSDIAKKYGISESSVTNIKKQKTHKRMYSRKGACK